MLLCIPLKKKTVNSLIKDLKKAQKIGDVIEIWFDELKLSPKDLAKIFQQKKKPFIYKISKKPDADILKMVEYVDIDCNQPVSFHKKNPHHPKTIVSYHNYERTPSTTELKKIAATIMKNGADIVKIAAMANNFSDSMRMLGFLSWLAPIKNAICLCMGKEGKITRLTGHLFGNCLMYAPLDSAGETAQGQIAAKELKKIIECL